MNNKWFCKICGYGRVSGVLSNRKKAHELCVKHAPGGSAGGPAEWIRWNPQQDTTLDHFQTKLYLQSRP